jgi:hypothetical protein
MEENKLIAEFMGVDQVDIDTWLETNSNLKYHTSWDWLIPVVEKCLIGEAEQSEEISNTTIKNIYEGICNQDISFAYKSVVEFINTIEKMESNKLIAEFMGLETPNGIYFEYLTKDGERSKLTHFILLEYHLSWDWLMPVIEEIDHLQFEPIESIEKALFTRSIRDTHKAVVEFIKQHNDEQNKA